jgi:5'-nucleotidase
MKKKLRILLTNDDGIDSPGLEALHDSLKDFAILTVVAPEVEQSAVSHAISSLNLIRLRNVKRDHFEGIAVKGTPADCIKIALRNILQEKPDLIISGINVGANIATNILYSGTVAAAKEGALFGIKSIAISISRTKGIDFTFAKKFVNSFIKNYIEEFSIPPKTILNVNIPACPENEIEGIEFTRQGKSIFVEKYEERLDFKGNLFYLPDGSMDFKYDYEKFPSDDYIINQKKISITPLTFDSTDYETLEKLSNMKSFLKWR